MTVQVSVRAGTVREIAAAAPELSWIPVRTVDDRVDEPDELTAPALEELDDRTFRRARAALPRESGLYLWNRAHGECGPGGPPTGR